MKPVIVFVALSVALVAPLIGMASARADTPIAQREPPAGAIRGTRLTPPPEIEIVTPTPTPLWLRDREATTLAAKLLSDQRVRIVSPSAGQVFTDHDIVLLHVVRASQRAAEFDRLPPRFDLQWEHRYDGESWRLGGMPVTLLDEVQYAGGMPLPAELFRRAPNWRLRARLANAPGAPWSEWTEFRVPA